MNKNKRVGAWTLICVLALAILLLLLIWRVPFGYDWTDEEYYSAIIYRLLSGDRLLVDTWEVHQFSAVLAAPVLGAYLALNGGSTDGCILFMRYFYVSLQFLISVYAFFTLRKQSGNLAALIAAAMLLGYTHFAINSFYYDSMALLFSVLSVLLIFDYFGRSSKGGWLAAVSGATYAASVMAFPHFILSLPVYIGYWWVRIKKGNLRKQSIHGALCFLGGGVVVAGAVATLVFAKASLADIASGVSGMLSDPDHQSISVIRVLGSYLNAIRVIYGPVSYGAAGLLMLGVWFSYIKRQRVKQGLRWIGAIAVILLLLGVTLHTYTYDMDGYHRINLLAAGLALLAPGLYFLSGKEPDRVVFLYFAGCALSISTQIGSNTRILAASGMLLPASVATVLYLFDHKETLFHFELTKKQAQILKNGSVRTFQTVAVIGCAMFVAALFIFRLTSVYRDATIANLDTMIETGAAKGIYTTQQSANTHDQLVSDIRASAPEEGSILIVDLFPEGYMLTNLAAATPSVYRMHMDSEWLEMYYEENPKRRPSVVFTLNQDMGFIGDTMSGSELYKDNLDYKETIFSSGTAYTLIWD